MRSFLYKNSIDVVNKSSSGGAFNRLAQFVFDNFSNVVIYGAAWDDKLKIHHTCINSIEKIGSLSGSKYARSEMGSTFSNVTKDLISDKTVIFSGTPCQIAGLQQFLKIKNIDTSNLYLVDIICHGTPSPLILSEWIKSTEKRYKHRIISLSFRDKRIGWNGYPTKIVLDNGKVIRHTYKTQEFIRLFFTHAILGPSCYNCPFSNMNRNSDVTMGDFWGIENSFPNINSDKGVSLVLANSKKGMTLLENIQNNLSYDEVLIECLPESFLPYQTNLNKPTGRPNIREDFWKTYKDKGFDYTVKKFAVSCLKDNIKFNIKVVLSRIGLYNKTF